MPRPIRAAATAARNAVKELSGKAMGQGSEPKAIRGKRKNHEGQLKGTNASDSPKVPNINNGMKMPAGEPEVSPYFSPSQEILRGGTRLGREFFDQDSISLCKALLGTVLCRKVPSTGEILRGTIVETEAYPGSDDRASHSYQGRRTPGNQAMFMPPGTAYVYFTYGMYYCFNISSKGEGSACLIRAIEPLEDYETMHQLRRRGPSKKKNKPNDDSSTAPKKKKLNIHELANGPSKLCLAFGIEKDSCDKIDMATSNELWLEESQDPSYKLRDFEILEDKRIGIDSTPETARNQLWRFYIKDSWSESRAKIGELKKQKAKNTDG